MSRRLRTLLGQLGKRSRCLTFADLFCGIGSFHVAMSEAGCKCVYACDISHHASRFYQDNFGILPMGDITKTDPSTVTDFDILCAGFPCQSFSLMGLRRGLKDEKNGPMFDHLMRFVRAKKPSIVLLENVEGILTADGGKVMEHITDSLSAESYRLTHKLLRCQDFGTPQGRKRVFIVGVLDGITLNGPVSSLLDVDRFKTTTTLQEFLKLPVIKKFANTIRIGGRSDAYSPKNWNQYLMRDGEIYCLTVLDGIRLQGFEGFTFDDSESQVWRLLGNTIPTVLSRIVTYSVLSVVDFSSVVDVSSVKVDSSNLQIKFTSDMLDDLLSRASSQDLKRAKEELL